MYDFIDHPEHITALREELESGRDWWNTLDQAHLLDSFIKESARLHPSDSISMRRKALELYTFKDGTTVSIDDWVCVPLRGFLQDPRLYPNADYFDGRRFMRQERPSASTENAGYKFTDLKPAFPLWGLGKHAW